MLEFLSTIFGASNLISYVVTPILIFVFVFIVWAVSMLTNKPFKMNLGIIDLSFPGRKDKAPKETPEVVPPNESTQANQNLLIYKLQSFITEKQKQIFKTQQDTIVRQMNFVDEKIVEIRSMYVEEFAKLLKRNNESHVDVRNHQEFRNYKMMIDLMLEDIKQKTFKKSIKQNHLADITMDLWESFIDQKVSVTQAMIKDYFDNNYPDDMSIDRVDVDEANDRVFDKCRYLFTLSYRRAREIAIETRARVHYIEDEIEREIRDGNIHFNKLDDE